MAAKTAGDLNHYGELQQDVSTTRDTLGQVVPDWRKVSTVWFRKETPRGMEILQASQIQAVAVHKLTLRYRTRVHARMRVVEGTRVYHFAEPPRDPDGKRHWLEVMAKEEDLARSA